MMEIFQANLFMLELSFPYFPIAYIFVPHPADTGNLEFHFVLHLKSDTFNISFKGSLSSLFH